MIEIPEAFVLARQVKEKCGGKTIGQVVVNQSPHKYVFFYGDPQDYEARLRGAVIEGAAALGGLVEVRASGLRRLLFGDGVHLRFHESDEGVPKKHQLLVVFGDGSGLSGSVQMYGGLWCYLEGELDNPYYETARAKPSPLSEVFNAEYFQGIITRPDVQKLSLKACLATEQRIPGLGNGVLQDVLWRAGLHPKRKVQTLNEAEVTGLFSALKDVPAKMAALGGRDTETDLMGNRGGYLTTMSRLHLGQACSVCGESVVKEAYLGGSIYFCPGCQRV
jgi:formamidopyrimidine-DNA glycosylase